MSPVLQNIQSSVVPVVMISANGLLCLAFYNRLSAVITRSRMINKERFDLATRVVLLADSPEAASEKEQLKSRLEILDELGHRLFRRACWIRGTLFCMLISVLLMLACSLALGLSSLGAELAWPALLFFGAGLLSMMAGILMAIQELRLVLDPLRFETRADGRARGIAVRD